MGMYMYVNLLSYSETWRLVSEVKELNVYV